MNSENKEEVAQYITSQGYPACNENGVVMVRLNDKEDRKKVDAMFKKIGYEQSKGYRY